jgi:hypothetical protein
MTRDSKEISAQDKRPQICAPGDTKLMHDIDTDGQPVHTNIEKIQKTETCIGA